METNHWRVGKSNLSGDPNIKQAAALLQKGEVVAFPTETVYGLGGQVMKDEAVQRIFDAKGRPSDNPLIVHIANREDVSKLARSIPAHAYKLMDAFWPGPLTVILPKQDSAVSSLVTAGLDTIAIRMPDHPAALALIQETGLPLAAPSANRSGKPSPTTAAHVLADLTGRIAGVIDAGETGVGLESTVVDCTGDVPVVLRPGGITESDIARVVGQAQTNTVLTSEKPKAPGMKYTHYAPEAPLYLTIGTPEQIQQQINRWQEEGKRVGVMAADETAGVYRADMVVSCGSRADLTTVARKLYASLRQFNDRELDVIIAEPFSKDGVGEAIMNRLEKAAGYRWIESENKS